MTGWGTDRGRQIAAPPPNDSALAILAAPLTLLEDVLRWLDEFDDLAVGLGRTANPSA